MKMMSKTESVGKAAITIFKDIMMKAFDTTENTTSKIACLKEHGITTVCRYYAKTRNWKCLQLPEAEALSKAGISLVAVY